MAKQVKWTAAETQKIDKLKAQAIDAQISGDTETAIAKAKEMHDLTTAVRRKKQMRAGKTKACKGVVRVTVAPKAKVTKMGEDLLKRTSSMLGA
jgi:hypothetical protein